MGGVGGSWWPFCIWCVSTLSGMKEGDGGRDRKKREGRGGQGEKESEKRAGVGGWKLKEKSVELPAVSWPVNEKQS